MELPEALRQAEIQAKTYQKAVEVLQEAIKAPQVLASLQTAISQAGIKAAVQNVINREADLIAKFNQLDGIMNQPVATGI